MRQGWTVADLRGGVSGGGLLRTNALNLRKATAGTFRRPDAKPTIGLFEPLAARLEHRDG